MLCPPRYLVFAQFEVMAEPFAPGFAYVWHGDQERRITIEADGGLGASGLHVLDEVDPGIYPQRKDVNKQAIEAAAAESVPRRLGLAHNLDLSDTGLGLQNPLKGPAADAIRIGDHNCQRE